MSECTAKWIKWRQLNKIITAKCEQGEYAARVVEFLEFIFYQVRWNRMTLILNNIEWNKIILSEIDIEIDIQ